MNNKLSVSGSQCPKPESLKDRIIPRAIGPYCNVALLVPDSVDVSPVEKYHLC